MAICFSSKWKKEQKAFLKLATNVVFFFECTLLSCLGNDIFFLSCPVYTGIYIYIYMYIYRYIYIYIKWKIAFTYWVVSVAFLADFYLIFVFHFFFGCNLLMATLFNQICRPIFFNAHNLCRQAKETIWKKITNNCTYFNLLPVQRRKKKSTQSEKYFFFRFAIFFFFLQIIIQNFF